MTIGSFSIHAFIGATIFPPILIAAALCDIATFKIPNIVPILLVAGFFSILPLVQMDATQIGLHVAIAAGALALGVIAFGFGWMGGGDGKLLAACALWFGPADILNFVFAFSLIGGALALLILTSRRVPLPAPLLKQDWLVRLWAPETGLPYAVAFAAAALLLYPQSEIWQRLAVQ